MNKLYSVHDHWTDINKKNDVDIESIDGVITGIKVNGEDYGGGSSDFSTAEVTVNIIDFEDGAESPLRYLLSDVPKVVNGILMSGDMYVVTPTETITIPIAPNGASFGSKKEPQSISGSAVVTEEGKDFIITVTGDAVINYKNEK